MLHFVCFETD